ncbi:NK1 transcription factor-related protein 2 isoform X2 [Lates japonicus]|uniref:NK1 transcription factor-related protein 2 isoform X2 n=1 Tax=Lates japonicus TaxID=270547 RepID=A0AAD3N2P9_LATJO|nr:NK1 transcription factor-related protein 2 isoform X2 [Lates japonicus]
MLTPRLDEAALVKHDWESSAGSGLSIKRQERKPTNADLKRIISDCRPINIVEDQGLQGMIQISSGESSYKTYSR